MQIDLAVILTRCRAGDGLAWELLVRSYQQRVFGMALHYLGNPEDARDVAQEVFVKIFRNLHRCPPADEFLPWLLHISRNASLDQLRRRKARPATDDLDTAHLISDAGRDPQQDAERTSLRRMLQRALGRLTRLNREIILLKEVQGLKLEEVARMLKIPVGTAKSRAHRARLELAETLLSLDPERADPAGG